jgi:hypothetical protein
MNLANFLSKQNIDTILDVIIDEDIFKCLTNENKNKIVQTFGNNIKGFFEREKTNTSNVMDMNKKYIMLILNHIKQNFSQQTNNKIKIYDEPPVKELITYEEIQNERKSQFEKDFMKLQTNFTETMSQHIPEVPKFADDYSDKPIGEMDKIVKEMAAKRNYEMEQFNRSYDTDINNVSNWLSPTETSVKKDKYMNTNKPVNESANQSNQITEQGPSSVLKVKKEDYSRKTVTWEDSSDENIFNKLKKTNTPKDIYKLEIEDIIELEGDGNNDINNNENKNKIEFLEKEINNLNTKLDIIIELLRKTN